MKNFLLALSLSVSVFCAQAQQSFSGQPNVAINGNHNVTIPCGSGGGCYPASSLKTRTGFTDTYSVDSIPYVVLPSVSPVIVPATQDDIWSQIVPIPFNVCMFGNNYNAMVIGSNGIISFDLSYAGGPCPWQLNGVGTTANPIPNPSLPVSSIMGPYQDIFPPSGGTITYDVIGTFPRRIFVVSFNQVPQFQCTNVSSTSQIAIYEGTNIIDIYIANKSECAGWNNGNAIEGIQNSTGTVAYWVPGRNNTAWTISNDAWRFTPTTNSSTVTNVKWHQDQSTTVISTADTAILCPPSNATTRFIVDVTYIQCDTLNNIVVSDTISIAVTQSAGVDQFLSCPTAVDSVLMAASGTGTWTAMASNPGATVITSPTSPTTSIKGFGPLGTYVYVWASVLCVDTARVIVSSRPNAGPDVFTCVNGVATMQAIGTGNWTALAGNPTTTTINNPTAPNTSISGFTVGGTYNFVWHFASCIDTASVIVPNFTISAIGDTSLCKYLSTNLSVSASPPALGPFTYLWLDSTLVQSPHSASTVTNPILNTTPFQVKVTSASGCVLIDTVNVILSGVGPRISITPSNRDVCPGDTITLNSTVIVANLVSCGLVDTCPDNTLLNNSVVGTGTLGTTVQSPYSGASSRAKTQYLFTAAELNAAGISSGAITDISFFVTAVSSTVGYDSFDISMGCTNLATLSGGFINTLQEVSPPSQVFPNTGWSPHPFLHYYNWDGVSNLVIQVCYTRTSTATNNSDNVLYTTTSYAGSVAYARSNSSFVSGCALNATTYSAQRPNVRFGTCAPNILTYQWTPHTLLCDTCPTTQVVVTSDSTYRLTVNDNGCINDSVGRVTINPYLAINATPDTSLCTRDTIQLNVALTNPPPSVCLPNYIIASVPYASVSGTPISIPTSSFLGSGGFQSTDDGVAGPFNIGFPFTFYCQTFNQFWVNTNAWISLVNPYPATTGTLQYVAQAFPPTAAFNNPMDEIALMAGDYVVSSNNTVTYFISGTAPNRILVVKYSALQSYSGGFTTTGEIHMYEGSGIIELMLQNSNYSATNHTTGIKQGTGVGVAVPGHNAQPYGVTTPEGWRLTPQNGSSVVINSVLWTPPYSNLSDSSIVNPIATPVSSVDYIANVALTINKFTNPEICVVRDTAHVRVGSFLHTLTATPSITCAGSNSQLAFTTTDSVVSYLWTPGPPVLSSATISNPVATVNDTSTFFVDAVDTNGCRVHDSITVYTYPYPNLTLGRDTSICYTDSVHLSIAGSYTSYEWYIPGNSSPVSTAPTLTAFPLSSYVLRLQDAVTTCFFYTDTITIDSFAHPILHVTASGPLAFCTGGNVTLDVDQGFNAYNWSPSGGSLQSLPVTTSGSYSYTASDANNCYRFSDTAIVVVSIPPSITLGPFKNPICTTDTDMIVVTTVPSGVPVVWTMNGAQVATGDTFITSTPGTYEIIASQGCPDSIPLVLTGAVSPLAGLGTPITECSCDPHDTLTPVVTPPTGITYVWSDGSTGSSFIVDSAGSQVYSVTVTDANGCTATADKVVNITCFKVHAVAEPDTAFVGQTFLLLDSPQHGAGVTYSWYPSDSLTTPTYPSTKGTSAGQQPIDTFYLAAKDNASQCADTSAVIVYIINHSGFRMATAFTPNGDGKNDLMFPVTSLGTTVKAFRVYNRWGQLVYDNPNAPGWNGSFGGNAQATDTYTYFVTVEFPDPSDAGKRITQSSEGSFQLFR
ncbi:MAG: hypothetical protein JWO03_2783 [Bacteroidetes bacterium]|nr:hypothetical protein [Bacteroidota bacterium]